MSCVFLMLFAVFCALILSVSGDDDLRDGDVMCSSSLTISQSQLICSLSPQLTEEAKEATLCKKRDKKKCKTASLGPQGFTFHNLETLGMYELQINTSLMLIKKNIQLTKIVKIPAPHIKLVVYLEKPEESFIWIEHQHDFVQDTEFQVKVLGGKLADKAIVTKNRNLTISRETVGGDGVYEILARAKPVGYFNGMWSEWSPKASFTIETDEEARNSTITYIFIIISVVLVFIVALVALQWRTHIKGYMKPNIPQPKSTLAQIHRVKERIPFTFSPEIFGVFIHSVDYVDEKPSAQDLQAGLDERCCSQGSSRPSSLCQPDTEAAQRLLTEPSHLKIRLIDESDFSGDRERGGSRNGTTVQGKCKDEAYVTMSSLFKTQ